MGFFSNGDAVTFGPISPSDIRQVFDYRNVCQRIEELVEDAKVERWYNSDPKLLESGSSPSKPTAERKADPLAEHRARRAQLESNGRHMECVALVDRFEVWVTRALSHHLLLSHRSDSECWSTLLQIPSASY